jgi:hypothetical protein
MVTAEEAVSLVSQFVGVSLIFSAVTVIFGPNHNCQPRRRGQGAQASYGPMGRLLSKL